LKTVLALTGASGTIYGIRLLRALADRQVHVDLIVSARAVEVIRHEQGLELSLDRFDVERLLGQAAETVTFHHPADLFAPPASGSAHYDGMAIVPCSMGTLGRVAAGVADDLITRSADVFLKERRKLILAPRETPLSAIHLDNLTRLSAAGATILPCMPSFYTHPQTVEDLVDTVVGRILDHLGVEHQLLPRWGEAS